MISSRIKDRKRRASKLVEVEGWLMTNSVRQSRSPDLDESIEASDGGVGLDESMYRDLEAGEADYDGSEDPSVEHIADAMSLVNLSQMMMSPEERLAELEDELLKARRRRLILESQNAADTLKLQRLEAGREAEEDLDATALSQSPASPLGLRADSISALGLSPVLSDVGSDGGASPTHLPPTPTGTADRLLANRAGSPGEGLAPRLSLADVTVGGAADKIIAEIEALREAIAMTRVQNEEIAQTARREAEIYRAQLKQALQERDQAHDHLLLLKQKWLEGYDELGQEFDLTEIGAEYQSQVKLIQHHHRLMDFANLELTTLRQSRKSTTDGLQESLVVLDAQHQTTLADLSDLRRAKALSSKDCDVARRAEDALQHDLDTAHARVAENAEQEKRCRSAVAAKQGELAELKAEAGKIQHEIAKTSTKLLERQDEIAKAIAEFEATAEAATSVVEERNAIVEACEALFGSSDGAGDGGAASAGAAPLLNEEEAAERRRCDAEVSARRQKLLTLKEQYDDTQGTLESIELGMHLAHDDVVAYMQSLGYGVSDAARSGPTPGMFAQLNAAMEHGRRRLEQEIRELGESIPLHESTKSTYERTLSMQAEQIANRKQRLHAMIVSGQSTFSPHDDTDSDDSGNELDDSNINDDELALMVSEDDTESLRVLAIRLILDLATARRQLQQDKIVAKNSVLRHWMAGSAVKACPDCARPFSLLMWRFHCRVCGGVFCSVCTRRRMRTTIQAHPVRCCEACYTHTLRAQKLRSLQKQHITDLSEISEAPLFQEIPITVCYSITCRLPNGGPCYSPGCRYAAENYASKAERTQARLNEFQRVVMKVKEASANKNISLTGQLLWEMVQLHRVPVEGWLGFIEAAFDNKVDYKIKLSTYATSFTTAMENCEDESMLAAIGARIKHEVDHGSFTDKTVIFLRFKYAERLNVIRGFQKQVTLPTSPLSPPNDDGRAVYSTETSPSTVESDLKRQQFRMDTRGRSASNASVLSRLSKGVSGMFESVV